VKAGKRKPAPSVIKKAKDKIKSIESEAPVVEEAAPQVVEEEEVAEEKKPKKAAPKKPARRSSAKDLKDKIKAARTEEEVQAVLDRHDEEVKAGLRKKLPSLFTEAKKRRAKIAEDAAKEEAKPTVAKTPKKSRFAALANDEIDARVAKLRQDEKGIQEEIKAEEDEDARQSLEEELEMVRREIDQYQQEIDERTAGGVGRRVQKTTTEQRKKETAEEAAKRYKDLKRQQANMDAEMDQLLADLRRAEESGDPDAVDEALAKVHRLQNDIAEVIGQAELINQKKLDAAAKKAQREARRKAGLVKTKKKTVTREKIPWYKTDEGDYLTSIGQAVAGIAEDIKRAWFRENGIWNLIDPTFIDHVIAEMKRDGVKVPSKKKILAELGADVDNSKAVHKYLDSQTEGAISLNDAGVTPNAFLDWLRTEQRKAQDSAPQRKEVVEALDEQRKAAWREARGKDEVVRTIDEEPEEETASEEKAKKEEADTERDVDAILREAERLVNEAEQQAEELKLRGEVEKMGRTTPANVSELSHMPYGRVENELNTTQNLETPVQDEKNVNPEEARALAMMRQAIKDKIELFAAEARELIGEIARISALPEKDSIDMEVIEQFNDSVDWYVKKIEEYMNAHDNLRLVRPKEGSFMEKLSDFALKNGVMLVIYDAGQFDVPFGAIATPGLIVLDSREISDKAVLAQNVVHELLHNMKRTMPDAWNTLAKRIQKLFPKTIDNIREWIISEYRSADENGQVVDPDDDVVLNEVISYVSGYRAEIILDALMDIADGKTIQDKTAWNQIKGFIKDWFRKFQAAMGWNNEDFKSFLLEKAEGDIGSGVDLIAEYVRAMRKAIGPERIDYGSSEWLASSAFDRAVETASMPADQPANPVIYNATNRSVRFMFGKRNAENADKGNPDLNPGYFKRRMTRRWRRTKQRWSGHRNVGREFYAVFVKKAREISASRYRARAARQRIQLMLLKLSRTHNKEIVGKALTQVLDGRMPLSQFQRVFNLKNNDDIMVQLNKLMDDKKKVQEMLATTGLPMGLRQLIRDSDFYATRFYAVHLLGQKYTPRQAEYNKAVEHMKAVFTEGFEKFIEKVHNENTSSMPFSVSEYLEADIAGREVMRSQVSKSKSQTLVTLGKNWDFWVGGHPFAQ
jgi:hypothetical protein